MVRLGIVGTGFGTIGLKPAFESIRGCTVVGVSSGRDWQSFLERNDLDAVAIAVPPAAQYRIAKAAIERGLHVFAEKPLAANAAQARELLALAKKRRVVHGIDFIFPEIAAWKKVKELLDKKTLGRLKHVSVEWDWLSGSMRYGKASWKTSAKEGGGALAFYFSHGLHYLEHFAGKIGTIATRFARSPLSDDGADLGFDMVLSFESGATGSVHLSSNTPGYIRHRLAFECERGVIVLENKNAVVDGFTITAFSSAGEKRIVVRKDIGRRGEDERVKIVRKLAQRFVAACAQRAEMRPSFADGVRVQELIALARKGQMR